MKLVIITALFLSSLQLVNAQNQDFYKSVDHIMKTYVKQGMVNYSALKANPTVLNEVVEMIKSTELKTLNDDEFVAFVVNAYNILAIYNVVNRYPIEGPLKVKGFFTDKFFSIGSVDLGLDDLEKRILFSKSKDAKLHLALSCAAVGCPPLSNDVFLPKTIDAQLNKQAIASINDANFIRINRSKKVVELSQIFEWYSHHFGSSKTQKIAFLNKYLKEPISNDYKVKYYNYDWNLNDWQQ